MSVGERNLRVTFQRPAETRDDDMYNKREWTDVGTTWAKMITTGGGEFFAAQRTNAETNAVFEIRYTEHIDASMRIKVGSRYFSILFINNVDGRFVTLQIAAKEVV